MSLIQNSTYKCNVVLTCGVFDVIHAGHVYLFEWVRKNIDPCQFVVALNTDESLLALGRKHIHSYKERAYVLGAIKYIDVVIPMHDTEPTRLIKEIEPEIFVKGGDYLGKEHEIPEYTAMLGVGGVLIIHPYKTHSSRGIVSQLKEFDDAKV